MLTFNRWDYIKLHRQVQSHCGIVVCTDDKDTAALAARIHQAIVNVPSLDNHLLRINLPHVP